MNQGAALTGRIQPGPRCRFPDRCDKPESAHRPHHHGETRPWGYDDRQCQVPSASLADYPECRWIGGHDADHSYQARVGTPQRRTAETAAIRR
jgi:hypothetical protein